MIISLFPNPISTPLKIALTVFESQLNRDFLSGFGKAKKVVQARTLWFQVLKSHIETGTPYMLFKAQNNSPEIKEPIPKIQKIDENGVHQTLPTHYFWVNKPSEKAILPSRASPLSAGYDLSRASDIKVPARGKALVPTDPSIAVPEGTYARIAPQSGLAWKHSIDVGAGVIDADYRGPVGVILFNYSDIDFEVKSGDRIAQLIIEKIVAPEVT